MTENSRQPKRNPSTNELREIWGSTIFLYVSFVLFIVYNGYGLPIYKIGRAHV